MPIAQTARALRATRVAASALILLACSAGEGSIDVSIYGESFIEDGIPAAEVEDGWSVVFEHFRVTVGDITIAGQTLSELDPVDLTQPSSGEGQKLGTVLASAGEHGHPSLTISRIEVEGSARKDEQEKTFHWIFDQPTRLSDCETTTRVTEGEAARFQITIHADHLLYDSLVSAEPRLLFGPLADADADEDGEIAEQELRGTELGAYDPGSEGGVDDLWSYLSALAVTVGHVDGEGHCHAHKVE